MKLLIASLLLLNGCVTPDHWSAEEHRRGMMQCYVMCKKTGAASYESWTAECVCNKKSLQ